MHAHGKKTLSISLCGIAVSAVAALGFSSAVSATSSYSISNTGPGSKNIISTGGHGYGSHGWDWNKWMEYCGYDQHKDHDKKHGHKDHKDDHHGWNWTYKPVKYVKYDKHDKDKKHYGHHDKWDDHKDYGHDKKEKKHYSYNNDRHDHKDRDDHKDYGYKHKDDDKKDHDYRGHGKHYAYKSQRSYERHNQTNYRVENNNNVDVDNNVHQVAHSGNASVSKNTRGGNATSGRAVNESAVATNVAIDNRTNWQGSGQQHHSQPSHHGYGNYRSTNRTDYRVENNNNVDVDNNVHQVAHSGNASVSKNTWGGSATTGSAANYSSISTTVSIRN